MKLFKKILITVWLQININPSSYPIAIILLTQIDLERDGDIFLFWISIPMFIKNLSSGRFITPEEISKIEGQFKYLIIEEFLNLFLKFVLGGLNFNINLLEFLLK